jgi:hypothetical protein
MVKSAKVSSVLPLYRGVLLRTIFLPLPDVLLGIKHFRTNRIRLDCQETYLDKYPCVIIVPMLTLEGVKFWNGEPYEAIVLAGYWNYMDQEEHIFVPAAQIYASINASANMQNNDNFANFLATRNECKKSCLLLKRYIFFVIKAFRAHVNLMRANANDLENFAEWKRNLDKGWVPVPFSNEWDVDGMKVRKVSFAASRAPVNPAPDPVLLLAKAASNWLKRHDFAILPGWCDDNFTSRSDDDSADSVISYSNTLNPLRPV